MAQGVSTMYDIQQLVAHNNRKHKQKYIEKKRKSRVFILEGKAKLFNCQFYNYSTVYRFRMNYHV